jgi:hypothetical protein
MLAPSFTPAITTDQADYAPGSVVTITGSGWPAGDSVSVFTNDTSGNTWSQTDHVTTDASGDFIDTVTLPSIFISNYTVTASDASGLTATTAFTDGNLTSVSGNVTDSSTSGALSGVNVACTSGCNASISTTTDASGKYSFSGGNKLSFSGNGPATLILTFSKSGYASGTITLSNVSNGDSFANENIALNPSGPTKLAFTSSAFTGTVGQCLGPINVQTQNAGGTATNVTSTTTVNLATDNGSTGAGAFYSDNGCSSSITNRTITTGNNSTSFYYEASARGSGSHQLTVSATGLSSASQTETVNRANQATLSITAPTDATYGHADYTITTTGGSGTGSLSFNAGSSTACSIVSGQLHVTSGTGSCSITATRAGDNNYNSASSAAFAVTIHKAILDVTASSPADGHYGDQVPTISASYGGTGLQGFVYNQSASDLTQAPSCSTTYTHQASSGPGDYPTSCSGGQSANYDFHYIDGNFHVAKATVTVTADDKSKTYNGLPYSPFTVSYSGFQYGQTTSTASVTGALAYTGNAVGAVNANTYAIAPDVSALSAPNYTFTPKSGTLTILPAPLTVRADDKSKVFDGSPFTAFTRTISGFVNGENSSLVIGTVTYSGTAVTATTVGTYTITPVVTGLSAPNYFFNPANGTLTISPWNAAGKGFYAPIGADLTHSVFTAMGTGATPTAKPAGMVWNVAKGGQTIPMKFNIFAGSVEKTGNDAFPSSDPTHAFQTAKLTTCMDAADTDTVDYTTSTGQTTLRYDTTGMQWIENWATPKVTTTTCYRTWVTFADGSTLEAFFQLSK